MQVNRSVSAGCIVVVVGFFFFAFIASHLPARLEGGEVESE